MQLTRASQYAIHALVFMAAQKENRPIASHIAAQAQGIPERFLLKVLLPLVSAGLLRSVKGPNGGYRLAKTPKEITLLDIVEAVDGPIQSQVPFEGTNGLGDRLDEIIAQANDAVRKQFKKHRLADLVGKA